MLLNAWRGLEPAPWRCAAVTQPVRRLCYQSGTLLRSRGGKALNSLSRSHINNKIVVRAARLGGVVFSGRAGEPTRTLRKRRASLSWRLQEMPLIDVKISILFI